MDRDKPPFGPAGDSMDPPGDDDSWSDRDLSERARRAASEREVAERYRFARSEQRNPTVTDDYGGAGDEQPRRSFERMGRFSRDNTDSRSPGDADGYSTPSSRLPEPDRPSRMDRPSFSDRASETEHPAAPKRPAFLNRSPEDGARSDNQRPSFLDRSNEDSSAKAMKPSFLDRPEINETPFDDDYEDRPQPVRRSFRGALPKPGLGTSGPASGGGSDLTDWPAASNERSDFSDNDGGYEPADPRERRFDLGQPSQSHQEREPASQASKDWRSSRFASRFSQPPKAYDLDEVADQEISFDPGPDAEPIFESPREIAPRFSEEDLVQKARARSRNRFARSNEPDAASEPANVGRYNQFDEPAWEPEAPPPEQIVDDRGYEATYEEEISPPTEAYMPVADNEVGFEPPNTVADRYESGATPEVVEDFNYEPEDGDHFQEYMPDEDTRSAGPIEQPFPEIDGPPVRSADVYSMQAPSMHASAGQGYNAPAGQAYEDPGLDPYEVELDQDHHDYDDYDDYDTGGHRSARGSSMEPDDMRGERAGGHDDGYGRYGETFQDFDEKDGRRPVVLIGALVGVAVVAGGLIFAYQMFSPEGNDQVPVVKLEDSPSKVAPNDPGGLDIPHQNKLIYDRIVGEETAVAEKVVPREEKVIELESDKAESTVADASASEDAAAIPAAPDDAIPEAEAEADTGLEEATAILDSGDGADEAVEETAEAEAAPAAAEPPLPSAPEESIPLRVETVDPPAGSETEVARAAPPIPVSKPAAPASSESAEPDASSGGPIQIARIPQSDDRIPQSDDAASEASESLEPEAPADDAPTAQPAAQSGGDGAYMVQIAAFRTEPEAQAEFRRLQGKHSGLLESYGPAIQKADLGSRGIYYRLRVGPIATKQDASSLCNSLIEAGEKDCLVRTK